MRGDEMVLSETEQVAAGVLPLAEFRDHLRLGSGFAEAGVQDALLESHLRAALAAIEGRTAKMLLARGFRLRLAGWRAIDEQALPCAPVAVVSRLAVADAGGEEVVIDPSRWRLVADMHRPRLVATGAMLPAIPAGGWAELSFVAGFGADWAAVPADLRQAVLLLAAQYHEARHEGGADPGAMCFGVAALIERWRNVRVLGGRPGGAA